jgi:hypothetical protein
MGGKIRASDEGTERRSAPVRTGGIDPLAKASFAAALSPFAWLFVFYLPPVAIAIAFSGTVLGLILAIGREEESPCRTSWCEVAV